MGAGGSQLATQELNIFADALTPRTSWWKWIVLGLLSVLIHFLFGEAEPLLYSPRALPQRVEVSQITPEALERIRSRARDEEGRLLINRDKNRPKDAEAPKDARYISDRNIRVEREQK